MSGSFDAVVQHIRMAKNVTAFKALIKLTSVQCLIWTKFQHLILPVVDSQSHPLARFFFDDIASECDVHFIQRDWQIQACMYLS